MLKKVSPQGQEPANKQIAAELLILVFIEIGLAHNHLGD